MLNYGSRREKTIYVVRKVAEEKEGELEAADELEVVTMGPRLAVARIAREGGERAQWRWPRRRLARSSAGGGSDDRAPSRKMPRRWLQSGEHDAISVDLSSA